MAIDLFAQKNSKKRVFHISYVPTPKQAEVDNSDSRFKILRWGRKTGKTTYAEQKALRSLGKPNSVYWHIAPTYKQAKLISWEKFKRLVPPDALGKKPNDTDLIITLKNGSQLFLMGSDDPDSLRGPEPDGITMEEAAYHKEGVWSKVLRPALMPKKGPALFISTPAGYNWFKDLEDEARRLMNLGDKTWTVSHATCYDNPFLEPSEIEAARRDCDTEQIWRQEYMAEYESSVGRVFSVFSDDRHVKKILLPANSFECWRSVDWGMRDDTACLWAFVRNGILYVYREYLGANLPAPSQAEIIGNLTSSKERVSRTAISHDAAKEDPTMRGLTVLWHFRQAGLGAVSPSSRDKKHSRNMIQELFHENRLVIDGEKCPKLRKQILGYEWKDTSMEKTDDTGNDDAVDALHYLVEMLQFNLFMGRSKNGDMTRSEVMAAIAREKLEQQRRPHYTVPSMFKKDDNEFGSSCEDSAAGYI